MHLPGADKTAERSKDLHAEVLESAEGEGRVSWGHLTPTHSQDPLLLHSEVLESGERRVFLGSPQPPTHSQDPSKRDTIGKLSQRLHVRTKMRK